VGSQPADTIKFCFRKAVRTFERFCGRLAAAFELTGKGKRNLING
jgi:hypothetical protein